MNIVANRYQLGQLIGKGSFGSVYLAGDIVTRKIVAVKIINKKLVNDTKAIMNEILILHKCQHENIIKLENYHEDADFVYIIQELAVGGQLFKHIVKRQHYSEFHAKVIIRQLLSALKYLHTLSPPIVHMDIKPENILLKQIPDDYDQNELFKPLVKLTDFGLSQFYQRGALKYGLGGTPGYIAPEVKTRGILTPSADIYSLGVVTYVLIAGRLPFDGVSIDEIYQKQIKNQWSFCDIFENISSQARDFIESCITLDFERRPTAEQLLNSDWLGIEGISSMNLQISRKALQKYLVEQKLRTGMQFIVFTQMVEASSYQIDDPNKSIIERIETSRRGKRKAQ
ncbi:Kinase [Hexamita inflata]|uniref:Kinase n=1 Tax=Hexamita inflata TaxID=28002 RepID=A0ABP1HI90_9EUKA